MELKLNIKVALYVFILVIGLVSLISVFEVEFVGAVECGNSICEVGEADPGSDVYCSVDCPSCGNSICEVGEADFASDNYCVQDCGGCEGSDCNCCVDPFGGASCVFITDDEYACPEYVYVAYSDGLRVIDVTYPIGGDNYNPREVGEIGFWDKGYGQSLTDVYVRGNLAYVAVGFDGLKIIDVSDPSSPTLVNSFDPGGDAVKVYVSSSYYAYVVNTLGLSIIDVFGASAGVQPEQKGFFDTGANSMDVFVKESYAYIAAHSAGLYIVYLDDSFNLDQFWQIDTDDPTNGNEQGYANGVYVKNNYAYVAASAEGLKIIDISDKSNPQLVGSVDIVVGGTNYPSATAQAVQVEGNYAYLAVGDHGLWIVDVSDPSNPSSVGLYDTSNYAQDVYIDYLRDGYEWVYVADMFDGLRIINANYPYSPLEVGYYDTGSQNARGVSGRSRDYPLESCGYGGVAVFVDNYNLDTPGYCSEQPPTCGNNLVEGVEECDGTDDSECPGQCISPGDSEECTCVVENPCADAPEVYTRMSDWSKDEGGTDQDNDLADCVDIWGDPMNSPTCADLYDDDVLLMECFECDEDGDGSTLGYNVDVYDPNVNAWVDNNLDEGYLCSLSYQNIYDCDDVTICFGAGGGLPDGSLCVSKDDWNNDPNEPVFYCMDNLDNDCETFYREELSQGTSDRTFGADCMDSDCLWYEDDPDNPGYGLTEDGFPTACECVIGAIEEGCNIATNPDSECDGIRVCVPTEWKASSSEWWPYDGGCTYDYFTGPNNLWYDQGEYSSDYASYTFNVDWVGPDAISKLCCTGNDNDYDSGCSNGGDVGICSKGECLAVTTPHCSNSLEHNALDPLPYGTVGDYLHITAPGEECGPGLYWDGKNCRTQLRILFIPYIYEWGDWESNYGISMDQINLFMETRVGNFRESVPLNECPDQLYYELSEVAMGGIPDLVEFLPLFSLQSYFFDFLSGRGTPTWGEYDAFVLVSPEEVFAFSGVNGASIGNGFIFIRYLEDDYGALLPHELGHHFGLEDEYCSNQAGSESENCNDGGFPYDYDNDGYTPPADINFLESDLGCDPTGENDLCCNPLECSAYYYWACCKGNKIYDNGNKIGRSFMASDILTGGLQRIDYAQKGKDHLASIPKLNCPS